MVILLQDLPQRKACLVSLLESTTYSVDKSNIELARLNLKKVHRLSEGQVLYFNQSVLLDFLIQRRTIDL